METNFNATEIENLLITIPSGKVKLRDDRIKKVWEVEINSFKLSKYAVTQDLYEWVNKRNPSFFKGDRLPVETVSWIDSIFFCNNLSVRFGKSPYYSVDLESKIIKSNPEAKGYRLPSEAEWQYACMAGSKSIRYGELKDIAWFKDNSQNQTQKVGQLQPNPWGLYDMFGNVWEWCSDIYDETVYGSYRIFRGGGWSDIERSVMSTTRRRSHPFSFKIEDLGFRIACNS